jgi:hypothetical protein
MTIVFEKADLYALSEGELDNVSGGQQLYKHEFPGAVNQMTGLRPFEPSQAFCRDPNGGLYVYG